MGEAVGKDKGIPVDRPVERLVEMPVEMPVEGPVTIPADEPAGIPVKLGPVGVAVGKLTWLRVCEKDLRDDCQAE